MGLLAHHRRPWAIIVLALLALPMLAQALQPPATTSELEARGLTPTPEAPQSLGEWLLYPRKLEHWLADHFGFRDALVRAHGVLHYAVVLPADLRVVFGRDEWLFFNGDGMIEQSMGLLMRERQVTNFVSFGERLDAKLRARNVEFLVTAAPNSTTIMRAQLPAWAAAKPLVTEYDVALAGLAARKVPALDLRPVLLAATARNPVYRRADTHWNKLGALVAYNGVVAALNRPQWQIDPARVFGGFAPVTGGDLARMLGVGNDVSDAEAVIDLSAYAPPAVTTSTFDAHSENVGDLTVTGRAGPAVMIIGDSFTQYYWPDYFALHASRVIWIHHEHCTLSESVIDEQKPDIVILIPAERAMFCGN